MDPVGGLKVLQDARGGGGSRHSQQVTIAGVFLAEHQMVSVDRLTRLQCLTMWCLLDVWPGCLAH